MNNTADVLHFDTTAPESGIALEITQGITRLVAPNPGPFTQSGTCSYLIGKNRLVLVDPGPESDDHTQALLQLINGRKVEAIILTHTHKDHSMLAPRMAALLDAPVWSGGPHRLARAPRAEETMLLDASADLDHKPDRVLIDGEALHFAENTLSVLATPGHAMNHVCFALHDKRILFSGDHVMGWSTTIVAPPDGAMAPFMASLRKMIAMGDAFDMALPGHGQPVAKPLAFMRGLLAHRQQREASILARLAAGDSTTAEIVAATYHGLDPRLVIPAQLSVFAQLEALIAERRVEADGEASLSGHFRLVQPTQR
jgi:glyoxylase-like metal-dependent hydrolase (beta-lactamase superfamily II)